MKKIGLILFMLFLGSQLLHAQTFIHTKTVFDHKTPTSFTQEWQYLTTDIFLLGGDRFNPLINEIAREHHKGFSLFGFVNQDDPLQYVNINAAVKNVKFFGGDLSYPVYSFRLQPQGKKEYTTYTTESNEVIRIFNNLPLAGQDNIVEATIEGNAITASGSGKMYTMVADQLQNLSRIANPTSAVLSLVGEFGNYLKRKQQGTSYKFKSTIRIYEGQEFNKKLHSVKAFMFAPSTKSALEFPAGTFEQWMDSAADKRITRQLLNRFFPEPEYPVLFVANYKSRYISEPVIGDEVDFETIEARRQKTENAYNNDLINRQTYVQEIKLLQFLEIFAQLKVDINNYRLNYDNKLTDDFSKNYFVLIREYRKLKQTFRNRKKEYNDNPSFQNEFREKYESILLNAGLYLEANHQLKSIKELVTTLFELNNTAVENLSAGQREQYLRRLYAVDIPESEQNSHEARLIEDALNELEQVHYQKSFKEEVEDLRQIEANEENKSAVKALKEETRNTNCRLCKEKVNEAIEAYNKRLLNNQIQQMQLHLTGYLHAVNDTLFARIMRLKVLKDSMQSNYPDTVDKPMQIQMLASDMEAVEKAANKAKAEVGRIDSLSRQLSTFEDLEAIREKKNKLTLIRKKLASYLESACKKSPGWCIEKKTAP